MEQNENKISQTKINQDKKQLKILKLLGGFFILMAIMTLLSRCAATLTIPKVEVTNPSAGMLKYSFDGNGVIQPAKEIVMTAEAGMRVEEIMVKLGQNVKKGDVLMLMDVSELKDKLIENKSALIKLDLALKEPKSSIKKDSLAAEGAKAQSENAREDKIIALNESALNVERAQKALEDAEENALYIASRTHEELVSSAQKEEKAAVDALNQAIFSRDEALRECYRAIEDAQFAMNTADMEQAATAYARLIRAQENLNVTIVKWDSEIIQLKDDANSASQKLNLAQSGQADDGGKQKAVQLEIERCEAALSDAINAQELARQKADRAIANADLAYEQAQSNLSLEESAAKIQREKESLNKKSTEIEIEQLEREIEKLEEIITNGGNIIAKEDGTIIKLSTEIGKMTTGEEILRMSKDIDGLIVKAIIDGTKMGSFEIGDKVKLRQMGKTKDIEGKIEFIYPNGNENEIIVAIGQGTGKIGENISISGEKNSENFSLTIPISSLSEDSKGSYVLIASQQSSIMGMQQVAARIDVAVIEKDGSRAAISARLSSEEKLIISSSKSINEGDRIRVMGG